MADHPVDASSASSVTETHSSPTREALPYAGASGAAYPRLEEEPHNPTRDTLADGLVGLLRPSLETLDQSVADTRAAQLELRDRIDSLERQLEAIRNQSQPPVDLENYIQKLSNSKKRILVVNSILQGAQVIKDDDVPTARRSDSLLFFFPFIRID